MVVESTVTMVRVKTRTRNALRECGRMGETFNDVIERLLMAQKETDSNGKKIGNNSN